MAAELITGAVKSTVEPFVVIARDESETESFPIAS